MVHPDGQVLGRSEDSGTAEGGSVLVFGVIYVFLCVYGRVRASVYVCAKYLSSFLFFLLREKYTFFHIAEDQGCRCS